MNKSISNDDLEIDNQEEVNAFCPFRNNIINEESPTFQVRSEEAQSNENDKDQEAEVSNDSNDQQNIAQANIQE